MIRSLQRLTQADRPSTPRQQRCAIRHPRPTGVLSAAFRRGIDTPCWVIVRGKDHVLCLVPFSQLVGHYPDIIFHKNIKSKSDQLIGAIDPLIINLGSAKL